jgi:hypothetical protein
MLNLIQVSERTKRISTAVGAALLALALALAAAPAHAARAPRAKAAATIARCQGDVVTVSAALAGARQVRGARLLVRFQLVPLFGVQRSGPEIDAGRKRSALLFQGFTGLPADTWTGIVRYRWLRGRRVVASGAVRTGRVKVGRRRGLGFCTLPVGVPPRDERPPRVSILPADSGWRRPPLDVRFTAADDLSGVAAVEYRLNGGEVRSGRAFSLRDEGSYTVDFTARDAAGNRSAPQSVVLRVDGGPPTAPVVVPPPSTTGDATPRIRWSASSDSGSGVQGYVVVVRDPAGSVAAFELVGAGAGFADLTTPLPDGTYTVEVTAFDGTRPEAWAATSEPRLFAVAQGPPRVLSSDPADGELRSWTRRDGNVVVEFDRPMDPATVTPATVSVARSSPETGQSFPVTCNSPCTTATIDPAKPLEGSFTLAVSGVRSEEGATISPYSATFRFYAYDDDMETGCAFEFTSPTMPNPWNCGELGQLPGRALGTQSPQRCSIAMDRTFRATTPAFTYTAASGQELSVTFDRFFSTTNGSDEGRVLYRIDGSGQEGYTPLLTYTNSSQPAGSAQLPATAGTHTLRLRFELFLIGAGANCNVAAGAGFHVDNIRVLGP